jgi:hypothetical protein
MGGAILGMANAADDAVYVENPASVDTDRKQMYNSLRGIKSRVAEHEMMFLQGVSLVYFLAVISRKKSSAPDS